MNYAPLSEGSTTCFGGLQSDAGVGFSIFGDIFLKSQYVVFDQSTGSPRIGFGQQ
jgi:aspergillopepsin I